MELKLETADVSPLTNRFWDQSFARIDKNMNAIPEREWNHLNYSLLVDTEIIQTKPETIDLAIQSEVSVSFGSSSISSFNSNEKDEIEKDEKTLA